MGCARLVAMTCALGCYDVALYLTKLNNIEIHAFKLIILKFNKYD